MAVRAAMVQMQGQASKEKSIAKAKSRIREAAAGGAKIVCLQELFSTIFFCYEMDAKHYNLAEPVPGATIDEMAEVAREQGIVLIAPIYERHIAGELYNTAVVLGPEGNILGRYRKSSIPLVNTASIVGIEKYYFRPGNSGFQVFPTPFGVNIGILICHDRHFPEAARVLALRGADILFIPSATGGMTRYAWEIEPRAHAIDNMYYVGIVNRVGYDIGGSPDQRYYGSSFFCDYRGRILSQAGEEEEAVIYADIDVGEIEKARNEWGFFRDRRPDLYADLVK